MSFGIIAIFALLALGIINFVQQTASAQPNVCNQNWKVCAGAFACGVFGVSTCAASHGLLGSTETATQSSGAAIGLNTGAATYTCAVTHHSNGVVCTG